MFRILVTIFILSHANSIFAIDADELRKADLTHSKENFLISNISFTPEHLLQNNQGVLTLCFKKVPGFIIDNYDHAALVFEMPYMNNKTQTPEIRMCMVHYGNAVGCGIFDKASVMIDDAATALPKVYRKWKVKFTAQKVVKKAPEYEKYATWILPRDQLTAALRQAEYDSEYRQFYTLNNCVKYCTKIMKTAGLRNCDFGFWPTTPNNLRSLVRNYIEEKPDVCHYELTNN